MTLEAQSREEQVETLSSALILPPRVLDVAPKLLDQDKVNAFRNFFLQYTLSGKKNPLTENQSLELWEKILRSIRIIDEKSFQQSAVAMSDAINSFIGTEPYSMVMPLGKSAKRLFTTLQLKRPPEGAIAMDGNWEKEVEVAAPNSKFVIFDDAAYSGERVSVTAKCVRKITPIENRSMVAVVGTTNRALRKLARDFSPENIFAMFRIPTLDEIFTKEEIKFLFPENVQYAPHDSVMTLLHNKVADLALPLFKRSAPTRFYGENDDYNEPELFYLIDDLPSNNEGPRAY